MATDRTSMDDILAPGDDKPAAEMVEKEPSPQEKAKAEIDALPDDERAERVQSIKKGHQRREWEAQGRDPETGQFTSKEEKKEETKADEKPAETKAEAKPEEKKEPAAQPPKQEMTEKERAFLKAAEEERRKRQALERELAQLRQGAQQPKPQADGTPPKTFWDNPEEALAKHRQEIQHTAVQTRIQTSEMLARQQYTDFDEKAAKFAELVQQNPALGQQFIAAAHPAEFAYRAAKSILDIEQAGGVEKLVEERVAKARAEERAKVEAELKKREEEAAAKRAALPPSLSDVQGAGRRPRPQWTGPTPMGDILKH